MSIEKSMTIGEFLNWLDGNGIIWTDSQLVEQALSCLGWNLDTVMSSDDSEPTCDTCGKTFTKEEWDERHGIFEDYHATCCPTCNPKP